MEKLEKQVKELTEKVNTLEREVAELKARNANLELVKEKRTKMWERFNQWLANVPNKDTKTRNAEFKKYLLYVNKCYSGEYAEKARKQMQSKLAKALEKNTYIVIPSEMYVDSEQPKVLYIQDVYDKLMSLKNTNDIQVYASQYLEMWENKHKVYINTSDWNDVCTHIKMSLDTDNKPLFSLVE